MLSTGGNKGRRREIEDCGCSQHVPHPDTDTFFSFSLLSCVYDIHCVFEERQGPKNDCKRRFSGFGPGLHKEETHTHIYIYIYALFPTLPGPWLIPVFWNFEPWRFVNLFGSHSVLLFFFSLFFHTNNTIEKQIHRGRFFCFLLFCSVSAYYHVISLFCAGGKKPVCVALGGHPDTHTHTLLSLSLSLNFWKFFLFRSLFLSPFDQLETRMEWEGRLSLSLYPVGCFLTFFLPLRVTRTGTVAG